MKRFSLMTALFTLFIVPGTLLAGKNPPQQKQVPKIKACQKSIITPETQHLLKSWQGIEINRPSIVPFDASTRQSDPKATEKLFKKWETIENGWPTISFPAPVESYNRPLEKVILIPPYSPTGKCCAPGCPCENPNLDLRVDKQRKALDETLREYYKSSK